MSGSQVPPQMPASPNAQPESSNASNAQNASMPAPQPRAPRATRAARRRPLSAKTARFIGGLVAATVAIVLGALAAWPIYESGRLWLVAAAGLVLGGGAAWLWLRTRVTIPVFAAVMLAVFLLAIVPVAVPDAFVGGAAGVLRGYADGCAAIALGWKQLLTLTLPVGSYRTVLVPAYTVFTAVALFIPLIARATPRAACFAALPMLAPVAFGTVFGASQVSAPLTVGPLTIVAPREIGLWLAAVLLAAVWVTWVSGADRRAALRLGRSGASAASGAGVAGASEPAASVRSGGLARGLVGAGLVIVALVAGVALAPMLDAGQRDVLRDRVDPELVVRDRPSPLADYRAAKRDAAFEQTLFEVSSEGALPERLRLAVLDEYDGVDFHVSSDAAGRFTRFPSGAGLDQPSRVTVRIGEGYTDIWAPTAELGSPPAFGGPRAQQLSDTFYVNRGTGGAIAVPERDDEAGGTAAASRNVFGFAAGDEYTADMEAGRAPGLDALGAPGRATHDLDTTPELASWLDRQAQPQNADGFAELIERLRDRGYLSHAMSEEDAGLWLERLSEAYGTQFEPSAGGHSLARIESLFNQLNTQEVAAGEKPKPAQLVAAIGDDEQFAAAAALIARSLGYDARVVLGVRLTEPEGSEVAGVPLCEQACTGEHLAAWLEVRGDRGEWVTFDATPQVELQPERLEQGEQLPEFPTTPEERDAREIDPPIGLGEQGEQSDDDTEETAAPWLGPLLRLIGLSLAALALLLLPLLFIPVAKRLRARRRRREQHPELRALGAWQEMVDGAKDTGVPVPRNALRSEVAAVLGTAPSRWAAEQVDKAVFSPHGIGPVTADQLWTAVEADRKERRASLGFWARLRAAYSLRSYGVRGRKNEGAAAARRV